MDQQVLYLTTTGRITGLPREIEIWFVADGSRLYILAEHFHRAQWVRNIQANARVKVRVDGRERTGTGRVLDPELDPAAWTTAQELSRRKYGWGEGLPVEIVLDEEPCDH